MRGCASRQALVALVAGPLVVALLAAVIAIVIVTRTRPIPVDAVQTTSAPTKK